MRFQTQILFVACCSVLIMAKFANANTVGNAVDKISCSEVQSIEAKCSEFDKLSS
jgi:hypothetical protein